MSITVENLTKTYGSQNAVDNISFNAQEGEILGLLGPNGAGKTTTMKIITSYLPATNGNVTVCGYDVSKNPLKVKETVGYLPEHNPLYTSMYVKEYLSFVSQIHKLNNRAKRIEQVIEETGLTREQNKKISQLSKGYRQRVGLAQAIIHNPKVLILDEPISGLDPNQLLEIRTLISNLKEKKTIIFSSHILQEVESICDKFLILDKGKIVKKDNIKSVNKSNKNQNIWVEFLNPISTNLLTGKLNNANIESKSNKSFAITYNGNNDARELIFDLAIETNNKILELKSKDESLEDLFKSVTAK